MEHAEKKLTTIGATEGEYLSVVGDTYRLVITGAQTNGAYAVIDMLVPLVVAPAPMPMPISRSRFTYWRARLK